MLKIRRYALLKPRCRSCDREWVPAANVSANLAFCSVCQEDRISIARHLLGESKPVVGLNGELRLLPGKRSAGH
jgi:hypothetical protein